MADTKNGLIAGLMGVLVVVIIVATVAIPVVDDYVDNRTLQRDQDSNVLIGTYSDLTLKDNLTLDFSEMTVDGVAFDGGQFGIWTDTGYVVLSPSGTALYVATYSDSTATRVTVSSTPIVTIQAGVVTVKTTEEQTFTFTKGYVSDPDGNLKSISFNPNQPTVPIHIDSDKEFIFVSPFGTSGNVASVPFSFKGTITHSGISESGTSNLQIVPTEDVTLAQSYLLGTNVAIKEMDYGIMVNQTGSLDLFNDALWLSESTTYTVKDTSATPMSIIPIILIISVVMGVIGLFYSKRFY